MGKKAVAKERIKTLFREAAALDNTHPDLANRYVTIAWDIALKLNVSFTKQQKTRFCRNCKTFLTPSINARYRVGNDMLKVTCLSCKAARRYRTN